MSRSPLQRGSALHLFTPCPVSRIAARRFAPAPLALMSPPVVNRRPFRLRVRLGACAPSPDACRFPPPGPHPTFNGARPCSLAASRLRSLRWLASRASSRCQPQRFPTSSQFARRRRAVAPSRRRLPLAISPYPYPAPWTARRPSDDASRSRARRSALSKRSASASPHTDPISPVTLARSLRSHRQHRPSWVVSRLAGAHVHSHRLHQTGLHPPAP